MLEQLPPTCRVGVHCEDCQSGGGARFRASLHTKHPQAISAEGTCALGLKHGHKGNAPWASEKKPRPAPPPLPPKSAGPGDLVEWAAKYTGAAHLARLYTHLTGEPCNCETRKDKLNKWWAGIVAKVKG